jgi:N-formylglutamate amidohydrolase
MMLSDAPAPFVFQHATHQRGLLLASPHSGRHYPADLVSTSRLDATALRRSEDAFMDQLIGAGPELGMDLLTASYARAYVDVNRDPAELDPALFHDSPLAIAKPSARVQAGLGVLPRVVGVGLDIYPRRISYDDALSRIRAIHVPYHASLSQQLVETKRRHGFAVLLDWHSMPSGAVLNARSHNGRSSPRVVLGDLNGCACAPQVTEAVLHAFERRGFPVSVNDPYAGGYTTQRYGRPQDGIHVVQVELDRTLYMDELRIKPNGGFAGLRETLTTILAELSVTIPALELSGQEPGWPMAAE